MADIDIPQAEADALVAMEKHCVEDKRWDFPEPGGRLAIELTSSDKRENFMLDITRARIKLTKATYQNRVRQAIVLMRLDLDGPPHTNPEDSTGQPSVAVGSMGRANNFLSTSARLR